MVSLAEKLLKNSTIKLTETVDKSKFFKKKDLVQTKIPALNLAQSGELDGGFGPGVTIQAGPSKHYKSGFVLTNLKAYLDKYPDSVGLFYDSEFGTPQSYFMAHSIPMDRVIHTPITNIEELKFDLMAQLSNIERGDKVFIAIDSIGNLASKKEVEDALNEKSVADMTRAKALKGLFRMVTPILTIKDLTLHAVSHTYDTMEMFSKKVVSGGTGQYYAADNIFILGRQQNKDGTEVSGYNFVINVEKSRYVREKMKIPITVSFEKGVNRWSGLLDLALESGHVTKPKNARYHRSGIDVEGKNQLEKETQTSDFQVPILTQTDFGSAMKDKFQLSMKEMEENESKIDYETGEVIEDEYSIDSSMTFDEGAIVSI